MPRIKLLKDYGDNKKGDIVELRAREAKQLFKANAAVVQADMGAESQTTKGVKNGNTRNVRSNNTRRR